VDGTAADVNGDATVVVARHRMTASVTITPPSGRGAPVLAPGIRQRLASAGVRFGIEDSAIEELLRRSRSSPEPVTGDVAFGTPMEPNADTTFEYVIDMTDSADWVEDGQIVSPVARSEPEQSGGPLRTEAEARTDYHFPAPIPVVTPGAVVGVRRPGSPGRPGMTVLGQPVEVPPPKDETPRLGAGLALVEKPDGTAEAVAQMAGKVVLDGNRLSVSSEHTVMGDVSVRGGDVIFPCDVVVRGNVLDGAVVKAGGNITVMGRVDGANLEAEGTIQVSKGIVGGGRGLVRARGDVTATFCEGATIESRSDIDISRGIMNSDISASGTVRSMQGRGAIIGGIVRAGKCVEAKNIGTESSGETQIIVGTDYGVLRERDEVLRAKEQCESLVARLDVALGPLAASSDLSHLPEDRREMVRKALQERVRQRALLSQFQARIEGLERQMAASDQGAVKVFGCAQPGTRVSIRKCQVLLTDVVRYAQLVENQDMGTIRSAPL